MTPDAKSPLGRDKLQSAIRALSDLSLKYPDKKRSELLRQIELTYDLSPLDCEFLDRHFKDNGVE